MMVSLAALAAVLVPSVAAWMGARWRRDRAETRRRVAAVRSGAVHATAVHVPALRSAAPPPPAVMQLAEAAIDPCGLTCREKRAFAAAVHAFDFPATRLPRRRSEETR